MRCTLVCPTCCTKPKFVQVQRLDEAEPDSTRAFLEVVCPRVFEARLGETVTMEPSKSIGLVPSAMRSRSQRGWMRYTKQYGELTGC